MSESNGAQLFRDYKVPPGQLLREGIARPEVSVVVPVYYNAETLETLYERISNVLEKAKVSSWDINFVDDGSGDRSREVLERLRTAHGNVRVVHLAKNHGSTPAILTGLGVATGRAVAVIAADLQDPPETLEELIDIWRGGIKIAIATRISREDPLTSRIFSAIYYRLFRLLVSPEMPVGGFDIAVLDQQVSSLMVRYAEKNTNFPAALLSLGFQRKLIGYHRVARAHGSSRWTFWRKFKLMYDSILSYSYRPLRLMTSAGIVGMMLSFGYAGWVIYYRLTSPEQPAGWASLMVVTLFFNGLVLTALGVIGEYIWRAFDAARKSPLVVVDRYAEPTKSEATTSAESTVTRADPRPAAPGIPRTDSASPPQA